MLILDPLKVQAKNSIICGVTNLRKDFCFLVKEARRESGISQSMLAAEIGCKQSAISMFEQGDGTKLGDEAIEKLSEKFGIPITAPEVKLEASVQENLPKRSEHSHGFCPNPHCPTNHQYKVDDRVCYLPHREECDPAYGKFCVMCGEILEKHCPNCGAELRNGAFCDTCGKPYISIYDR